MTQLKYITATLEGQSGESKKELITNVVLGKINYESKRRVARVPANTEETQSKPRLTASHPVLADILSDRQLQHIA